MTSSAYFRSLKLFFALNFSRLPFLFLLSLSWLFGSAAGIYLNHTLTLAGGLIALAIYLIRRGPTKYLSLFIIFLLAILRLSFFSQMPPATNLELYASGEVNLQGMVDGKPSYYNQTQRFYLSELKDLTSQKQLAGKVEITTRADVNYEPGQQIMLLGTLELTPGQGGRTYAEIRYPKITARPIPSRPFGWFQKTLDIIRHKMLSILKTNLPEPQASLAAGVVLGMKEQLTSEFANQLKRAGLTHIVVASGYNITIVLNFSSQLALFLGKRLSLIFGLLLTVFYALLTGGGIPVWRSVLMSFIALSFEMAGREREARTSLFLSAAFITLLQPESLTDLSFQLSFLATFGLLYFTPVFDDLLSRIHRRGLGRKYFKDALSSTLAAQVATLPVLIGSFGQVSLVAPLTNCLIFIVTPALMGLSGLTLLTGLFSETLSSLTSWLALVPLTYFVKVTEFFGDLPWAFLHI